MEQTIVGIKHNTFDYDEFILVHEMGIKGKSNKSFPHLVSVGQEASVELLLKWFIQHQGDRVPDIHLLVCV